VLDLGTGDSPVARKILEKRFNLLLRSVPLGTILEYITSATGTEARIDEYAIVIRPLGAVSDDIVTRNFRVPPDFLSRGAVNQGDAAADPFADEAPQQGLLGKKLTAEEFLKKQGVPFPDGATATYIASRSILTVRNTSVNLDYVQQVVDSIIEEEPAVVVIEATIISTTQNNLEELGFDWILSDVDVNGNVFLGGGTTGNGQPIQDFGFQGTNAITHGLRSGDRATETSSIDGAIARQQTPSAGGTFELGPGGAAAFTPNQNPGLPSTGDLRAPGAFAVVGAFDPEIVGVLVRGHDRKKDVSLMTQKTVVTRSGQTATIESVREFIYPTEYEPPEIPNQVGSTSLVDLSTGNSITAVPSIATPATPTAFDTTKLGCILEVEPLVDPSRTYVELALKPTIRRFDGFINYGTPIIGGAGGFSFGGVSVSTSFGEITSNEILMPVFSTITSSSNLTIADGSTVVMGGLMTNRRIKVEDKVPIFGDLPLVGRFFQSTADTNIRAALVITVTVRLTDPSGHPFRNR
jgi:general secretion pathway protein D